MLLLVVSYTPGSALLRCLEADRMPEVGDTLEADQLRAKVLHAEVLNEVQGCDCAVVVDDLTVGKPPASRP